MALAGIRRCNFRSSMKITSADPTKDEDQVSDLVSTVSIGAGHLRKNGVSNQWIVSGYASYSDHEEYDDLDHLSITGGFSWIHQPSVGYSSFWFGVSANATILEYRDSDAREGIFFDLDLNINRRLTTRVVRHLGYRYTDLVFLNKSASEESRDAAFDTAAHEIYMGLDYEIMPFVDLFAEYAYRHGGITSTVSGGVDASVDYEAQSEDPVFNQCTSPSSCSHRYSYRVVSDMQKLNIGIAFPLSRVNMDITASYFDADGGGKHYENWMAKLGLVWNF